MVVTNQYILGVMGDLPVSGIRAHLVWAGAVVRLVLVMLMRVCGHPWPHDYAGLGSLHCTHLISLFPKREYQ